MKWIGGPDYTIAAPLEFWSAVLSALMVAKIACVRDEDQEGIEHYESLRAELRAKISAGTDPMTGGPIETAAPIDKDVSE